MVFGTICIGPNHEHWRSFFILTASISCHPFEVNVELNSSLVLQIYFY